MSPHFDRELPEPFSVEVVPDRERIDIVPHGEIDVATVGQLRAHLDEVELAGFQQIVLDLRKVTFMDSTGLKLVIEEIHKEGIDFAVIPGSEAVQRVFEVTGLQGIIPTVPR